MPQYKFICDNNDNILVNKIYRFENFNDEINKLCEHLHIKYVSIPIMRKSKHQDYRTYYINDEIKKIVYDVYEKDFQLFNYI